MRFFLAICVIASLSGCMSVADYDQQRAVEACADARDLGCVDDKLIEYAELRDAQKDKFDAFVEEYSRIDYREQSLSPAALSASGLTNGEEPG